MQLLALALVLAQAATPAAAPAAPPRPLRPPRPGRSWPSTWRRDARSSAPSRSPSTRRRPRSASQNFLKYVRSGHYEGTVFHRVMPGFMIQGGGFTPELEEKPTQGPIKNEARNGLRNSRGTVAMARTNDPDSADGQFFINLRDNHRLDYGIGGAGYAVFGQVVEGMDVVDRIAAVPTASRGPHENVPQMAVVIKKVREVEAPEPAAAPKAAAEPPKP